jgi:hypothetical protein
MRGKIERKSVRENKMSSTFGTRKVKLIPENPRIMMEMKMKCTYTQDTKQEAGQMVSSL